ncbi:MAG: phytanoyl-CoA dioxygenase family protein [Candidatus Eremiobacterota bacterium]
MLTQEQVDAFHRDGFLVVRGYCPPEEVLRLERWTGEVAALPETPGKWMMYFESSRQDGSRILNRLENFVPYHEGFRELVQGRLQQDVAQLLGEPAVLFKDKINFKLPGGDGFKAHQDVQAGWDVYASLHLTAMVAVDRATAENGRLEIVRGQHQDGLKGTMWEPLTESDLKGMTFEPLDCEPGDAVFFDSFAPHRSDANLSSEPRRILYVTYNRLSEGDHRERYYADKRKSFPPDCEREAGRIYQFRV